MLNYKELIEAAKKPLSDKEYLYMFIKNMLLFKPKDIWTIKDKNSVWVEATQRCARLYGFKDRKKIVGLNYHEMIGTLPNLNEIYATNLYKQDRNIEKTNSAIQYLHCSHYYVGSLPNRCLRSAIINPYTNNTLGTIGQVYEFKIDTLLKTILDIHGTRFGKKNSMEIINSSNKFGLSNLECNVLFCICMGINNRKDIADFLFKAYKQPINHETTIGDATRRLYKKLNCNTHYQLIEFGVYNNIHLEIPQAFLPTGSYLIR